MMNEKCVFLYATSSGLVALCIFIYGYVPVFEPRLDTASLQDLPLEIDNFKVVPRDFYNSYNVEKLVVIVAESLSIDLLTDKTSRRNLPHLTQLIGTGEACLVPCKMPRPLTTTQKIKNLATGTRSSFVEAILTFDVGEVTMDNIFRQAKNHRLHLSLYGTETSTKLFPNSFSYSKIMDTSKIFDNYYEIDANATAESLITDIDKNNWNWFLLHYSGLKHLKLDPQSSPDFELLTVKLRELDNVVKFIHRKLNRMKNNYMLLVVGDTGMRKLSIQRSKSDKNPENIAPYIVIGTSCAARSDSDKIMNEFDLAPTLAVLTGLPIPGSSYGSLNFALLNDIDAEQLLYALHYNTARLMNLTLQLMHVEYAKHPSCALFQTAVVQHGRYLRRPVKSYNGSQLRDTIITLYGKTAECLSERLNDFFNTPDVSIQHLAFVLVLEAAVILINQLNKIGTCKKLNFVFICVTNMMILTWVLATGMSKYGTSLASMTRGKGFIVAAVTILMICNSYVMASQRNFLSRLFMTADAPTEKTDKEPIRTVSSKVECTTSKCVKSDSLTALLVSGTIVYAFSILESSYIEWEKFVLFFAWASLCFFIICIRIKKLYESGASGNNLNPLEKQRIVDQVSVVSVVFSILIMHRAIMAYTTVEYWLAHVENRTCASICLIFGLVLLALTCNIYYEPFTSAANKIIVHILLGLMCCSIYMSNAAHGKVILPHYPTSDGALEMATFWFTWSCIVGYGLGFCTIKTCYKGKSSARHIIATSITCWAYFVALLTRPHKVLLIPVQMLFGQAMADVFKKQNQSFIISHVWLGHLFFHYLGYTYSLDSLDAVAGLLFSKKLFSSVYGLLLVANIFSAPILSYLICVHGILDNNNSRKRASQGVTKTNATFGCCRFFLMSAYLLGMLVHRHSESYWSILSPKLLYEIVHTFSIAAAMIAVQIIGLFHDLSVNSRIPSTESNQIRDA